LERTAQELFVAQEFQELRVIFRTAADEVDSLPAGRAILHTLAAVKEPTLVLLGPDVCQLGHERLSRTILFGLSDVHEKRLIRRAGKGTEDVEEVVAAGRAGRNDALRQLQVARKCVDLPP
jgi:hypothetical protein